MKAIQLYETGGSDKLVHEEVERPKLEKGEILVQIKAIGINPVDYICRENNDFLSYVFQDKRPIILGWDISGEVVEKAEDADGFEIGDAVFGMLEFGRGGGYAEYVAVATETLVHKPDNIGHKQAASTGIAALTAWQAIVNQGKIKNGEHILIQGGSGGVGHFAVQIAKAVGTHVTATSSGKNRDFVLSLGADAHIDYKTQKFYEEVGELDFVFDTIGGESLMHAIDCVKDGGRIVTVIPTLSDEHKAKAEARNVGLSFWECRSSGADMEAFAKLLANGDVKPHVSATYPFSEMGRSHDHVEKEHPVGKTVVTLP